LKGVITVPKADKKQRRKAKRAAKRVELRRRESVSPIKRLAETPGQIECWMSDEFASRGQAQMFVYKRAAGLTGIACFLVDRGVVGLKDAWTRMHVDRMEFDEMIDMCDRRDLPMKRTTPEEIRRMVAGGVRWTQEHGMRLPKDWVKTASVIGGVGDWASAEVSGFVKEFAGNPEDLRQRLIGEPFDSFVLRKDVQFIFSDAAPYLDQVTGDYVNNEGSGDFDDEGDEEELSDEEIEAIASDIPIEEMNELSERFTAAAIILAEETTKWLAARGESPSPQLVQAWQSVIISSLLAKTSMPDAPPEELVDFAGVLLEGIHRRIDVPDMDEYERAVEQALEHSQTDPRLIQRAVMKGGMAGEADEVD
jgi:hypothetical protein